MSRCSLTYSFSPNLKNTFLNNAFPVVVQSILIENCRTANFSRKLYNTNDVFFNNFENHSDLKFWTFMFLGIYPLLLQSWNFSKFTTHFVNTVKKQKTKTETKQTTKSYLDKQQRRCKVHITYFEQEIPREKWLARQWRLSSCTLVTAIFEMICSMLHGKLSIYINVNTAWVSNNEVFI